MSESSLYSEIDELYFSVPSTSSLQADPLLCEELDSISSEAASRLIQLDSFNNLENLYQLDTLTCLDFCEETGTFVEETGTIMVESGTFVEETGTIEVESGTMEPCHVIENGPGPMVETGASLSMHSYEAKVDLYLISV